MNLTEAFEVLLKGRKMDVGAITTRAGGRQYQKQSDGKWVEYKGGAKQGATKEEPEKPKNGGIVNKFVFHGETYELPSDRFPSPPFITDSGLYIFDKELDKNVLFSKLAEDIQKNGSLLGRNTNKEQKIKGTDSKKNSYANDYKDAFVVTSSKINKKQIHKYMAVSGVPKGYSGDVYFTENKDNVEVRIMNKDIYMNREIFTSGANKGSILNQSFTIKNSGLYNGTEIFANQVKNAQKEGFDKIKTEAYRSEGWNGYYTWLRLGYKPYKDTDDEYAEKANKELGTNITSITDLMASQEGRDWWKENGGSFECTFDLSENSYSMKTLEEYVKNKNK